MGAEELALVIRRRFPKADADLEADLAECELAASGETVTPAQALRLVQLLSLHRDKLLAAARAGGQTTIPSNAETQPQERPR
ncbi:MAG: hypothetical protein WCE75_13395, partial [Terracidiphilus sp.]